MQDNVSMRGRCFLYGRPYVRNQTDSLKYTARGWCFDSIFRGKLLCYTQVCGAEADHCRGGIVFGFSAAHLQ